MTQGKNRKHKKSPSHISVLPYLVLAYFPLKKINKETNNNNNNHKIVSLWKLQCVTVYHTIDPFSKQLANVHCKVTVLFLVL